MPERTVRRVLIVSADMGEGHNATGRALAEAAGRLWPAARVDWLDTLRRMGPGVGPLFRGIYTGNVRHTPWLYEFFYRSLWRHHWFATASKRFVAAWCGRALAKPVAKLAPDVVLSTYPLGTAGLEWLRNRGRLPVPVGAWISDFAPHPFWVYADIDLNLVMHPRAAPLARRCAPSAQVAVSAPPVDGRFAPAGRDAARAALGLPTEAFVALVSCGSLGFGDVLAATEELLAADERVLPVVVCGRNDALLRRVRALSERDGRVRAMGWTDQMPELFAAADVVVSNAGGATSLEAIACQRPVLMYRPIAAHGKANAELMRQAGLALVCARDGSLTETVRGLLADPCRVQSMAETLRRHRTRTGWLKDGLVELMRRASQGAVQPLPAADALFLHVDTPENPQQLGTVLVLDPKPDGAPVTRDDAEYLIGAAPRAGARLLRGTAWRRPAWRPAPDSVAPLDVRDAGGAALEAVLDDEMDAFFGAGLDPTRAPCAARLITGTRDADTALLIKVHHAAGDGVALVGTLVDRTRGRDWVRPTERASRQLPKPGSVRTLARGLLALARSARAPEVPVLVSAADAKRHHSRVELNHAEVTTLARSLGVRGTELLLGLLAEGLHRVLGADAPERMRVMVPVSARTTRTMHQLGNHTGAAAVGLPTGPMPLPDRITATARALRGQAASGSPTAARAVVRTIGLLPPWLHRRGARLVYRGTWFNLIATVLPGARSPVLLHGARVRVAYPVVPLAPGNGLAVGHLTWADQVNICVTSTTDNAEQGDRLAEALTNAIAELRTAARQPESSTVDC